MTTLNPEKGTWVLLIFIAFFGVILAVNTVFITNALDSYSGVVTKRPYEKGLEFNKVLEQARAQTDIEYDLSYNNGLLRLNLPVSGADVQATFFRPTKAGMDFKVSLHEQETQTYTAKPSIPLPGAWTVKVKATWDNQILQISHDVIAK